MASNEHYNQLADYAATHHVVMKSRYEFEVMGFGKSGSVLVNLEKMTVTARYNEVTPFDETENLVEVLGYVEQSWTPKY
jgi:hypothetical protein